MQGEKDEIDAARWFWDDLSQFNLSARRVHAAGLKVLH